MPPSREVESSKMNHEKSFPNLRKKLSSPFHDPAPEPLPPPPSPPPRPKRAVAPLRDRTRDRSVSGPPPRPRPYRLPLSPGGSDDPRDRTGPRFMSRKQAERIEKVEYRPRPVYTGPKYPTIMGMTPNRLKPKPKPVEVKKRENKRTRVLKTLRNPDRMKMKWKGTKSFMRMRMFKRLNGCLRALHSNAANPASTLLADIPEQKPLEIEYKPIYRLKEIKRASILLARPKPKRPVSALSIASMDSVMSTNRKRYSDASVYSRSMSTAQPSAFSAENSSGKSSENVSLRASLVPYREWWAFLQSSPNPFREEEPNDERTECGAPATPIHKHSHNPHRGSSLFSFTPKNPPRSSRVFETPEDNFATPPSPTGSDLTITPSRYTFAQNMAEETKPVFKDPFSDSTHSKRLVVEKAEDVSGSKNKDIHHSDKRHSQAQRNHESITGVLQTEKPQKQLSPKHTSAPKDGDALDNTKIQIARQYTGKTGPRGPRTPAPKTYPGLAKGGRVTPSAIPISVRRLSAETGDITQSTPSEPFAGGIRVLDRPPNPRPRLAGEPASPSVPEPIPETGKVSESSTSSSSVGSWDLEEGEEEIQKPPTVFTGEYRSRPAERMGQHRYGPTLKIAGSADNIIMGTTDDRSKSSIVTPRSPARDKHIDTSKSGSPRDNGNKPKGQPDQTKDQHGSEQQSPTRNFCRPQASLEYLPKRDISNRELSVARKPLNRPSLSNLFAASADNLHAESTPPVPKVFVSDSQDGSMRKSLPLSERMKADATPTHSPRQHNGSSHVSTPATTPEAMPKNMPLRSHPPPRTSSLQAVSDFPMHSESDNSPKTPGEMSTKENDTPQLKRDVTVVNIAEVKGAKDQTHSVEAPRLPDSKSTRMLDSFRNIFKHKSGAEKGRTRKEEPGQIPSLIRDQSMGSIKSVKNADEKAESTKGASTGKAKPRLSDGVAWNKVTRNPKTSGEYSPALVPTPTSTLSTSASIPSPLTRNPLTPSFARPTQSTRTKASTSGSKPQVFVGQDGRPRRVIQGVAASTGSPQRLARTGTKRPTTASTAQRPNAGQSRAITSVNNQENIPPGGDGAKQPEAAQKSFKEIRSCIDKLCNKARDESTPIKREKYLRLALSLQQQLSDFQSVEKEADEAQTMFNAKRTDKDTAEETLFEYFMQVQVQLDEE